MKRVCLTGVESTGKSTLAPVLAARFGGVVMPEYGRRWAERNGVDFIPAALHAIAAGHAAARAAIAAGAPDLIIEDTDIVMTSAWARMLYGRRDPVLSAIAATADLYLLFAADTPWIDDGTRQFRGQDRERFAAIIIDELARRQLNPVLISGSWTQREATAIRAVAALLAA
ncbi:AAA family ATPase [Polymorphobacter fuscus]|uniref:AAA family ATPase n=1 Tax=Sandarakinorhabdus fusca TaxID=1439888 RepID=A0A7C9KVJ5_9SPHN|nr:ATP-binding protein [Polymorphobacter fuscus]KAB7648442.1 ATP-binding protein [Polymorphobacter fuscus]MQT15962.1 AAA family ATPase [Polymorphobacter fuscus]NJC07761.1 NadR type nicotinamide-nucleotide adenylyltransferase [Polymorphobacter fuscus]